MDPQNVQKETSEQGGLRLVSDSKGLIELPAIEKQFVNFMFFRMNPEWRRLNPETKSIFKTEFQSVFDKFRDDFLLFTYSLVGFDSKADLMFWRIGTSLDLIQEMTAKLYRTSLGSFFEVADNYLAVTKRMMFVSQEGDDRFHVRAGDKKYHFVYPCAKHSDWFDKSGEERDALITLCARIFGFAPGDMTPDGDAASSPCSTLVPARRGRRRPKLRTAKSSHS